MSDDDEAPIDRGALEQAWPAPEPPAEFAARATAAWLAEKSRASTPRRRAAWPLRIALAIVPLAAAAAVWLAWPRALEVGARKTTARESIPLGARGVAVAEAGAELAWRVGPSEALVTQDAGSVFYRVERGGPFVVRTAAGEVRVLGTCFRVEVEPMISRQGWLQMGAGAALATTVLVTVYEGKVLLANEHGQTALAAGESAGARAGAAPGAAESQAAPGASRAALTAPAEGTTREQLLVRDRQQRAEIERLRAQLQRSRASGSGDGDGDNKVEGGGKTPFFAPSKDEVAQLAKDCKLKWDEPGVGVEPHMLGPRSASDAGLSDAERGEYNRLATEMNTRVTAQLRALYLELTGDKSGADSLTPSALEQEIYAKFNQKDVRDVYYRMSHERAGMLPAPSAQQLAAGPPVERMQRMMSGLGDHFEQDLAQAIGPDHARALRAQNGGWGSRSVSSYGCPDDDR